MLPLVIERQAVLVSIVSDTIAQTIVDIVHEVTGVNGKYLVKRSTGMKTYRSGKREPLS